MTDKTAGFLLCNPALKLHAIEALNRVRNHDMRAPFEATFQGFADGASRRQQNR